MKNQSMGVIDTSYSKQKTTSDKSRKTEKSERLDSINDVSKEEDD